MFLRYFANIRLRFLVVLTLILIVIVPLIMHVYLPKFTSTKDVIDIHRTLNQFDDTSETKDIKYRVEELLRIKASISSELRHLENKRGQLQEEIGSLSKTVETMKLDSNRLRLQLDGLYISVRNAEFLKNESSSSNIPIVKLPLKLVPSTDSAFHNSSRRIEHCTMSSCFDYSRCSITSSFSVYLYHPDDSAWNYVDPSIIPLVADSFNSNIHITFDPTSACIYMVLFGVLKQNVSPEIAEKYLTNLKHWNGDGRNHVILNVRTENQSDYNSENLLDTINTGRAIIAQAIFTPGSYRDKFDIVLPPLSNTKSQPWERAYPLSPARRPFILYFEGEYIEPTTADDKTKETSLDDYYMINVLKQFERVADMSVSLNCGGGKQQYVEGDWLLCSSRAHRIAIAQRSTFSLILAPRNDAYVCTARFVARILESLEAGAIPVILGDDAVLPLDDVVDWRRFTIRLPKARITELHLILKTYVDGDILALRKQGRIIWERYFATGRRILWSFIAQIRSRLGIVAPVAQSETTAPFNNLTFQAVSLSQVELPDEILGPIEPPFPSLVYQHNFSLTFHHRYDVWNTMEYGDPFHLYPSLPSDPVLPSEAKFRGSGFGFRPLARGLGGSGREMSEALGGNYPREQFTAVILTYEREAVLLECLRNFHSLPYLNKVIVVWNSPKLPSPELAWPNIGVPIQVIPMRVNSLNNRFLPFAAIETDAILSLDDDVHLRHDEMILAFRVWRENRHRIVGFPGRYHAWDNQRWAYNTNHSCELSMVLTGAAFFHKFYSYAYTYDMPRAIKDKVDSVMNCEDLAMNFLIAHITRQPPIKVTSKWTFRCPGCPVNLSEDDSHFRERDDCINFFTQVWGYTPLLYTQFRADSVLFKTKIPHDKQKCFKYI